MNISSSHDMAMDWSWHGGVPSLNPNFMGLRPYVKDVMARVFLPSASNTPLCAYIKTLAFIQDLELILHDLVTFEEEEEK